MEDIQYINKCQHRVTGEVLNIVPVEGKQDQYTATFPYGIVPIKAQTFIRSYDDEQKYISVNSSYLNDLNYSYEQLPETINSVDLPIAGVIKKIGITNYEFTDSHTITFGVNPIVPGEPFISYNPGLLPQPKYLIDCYVDPKECPICQGTGIVQDVGYDLKGELIMSSENQKLVQRVLKTLLTNIGESPEDFSYGSGLYSLIGSEINEGTTISLQKSIYEAVQYLISLQDGETLTLGETCTGISDISVSQDDINPSRLYITIKIFDGEKNEVPCSLVLDL